MLITVYTKWTLTLRVLVVTGQLAETVLSLKYSCVKVIQPKDGLQDESWHIYLMMLNFIPNINISHRSSSISRTLQADIDGRFEELAAKMIGVREDILQSSVIVPAIICSCGRLSKCPPELQTKYSTSTSLWWAIWVFVKVRCNKFN